MDLFVNELSFHGQFHTAPEFREALALLMCIRRVARRFSREVYCHRGLLSARPMPGAAMQKAVGGLRVESERRAVMRWMTSGGPFWDDSRQHGEDDRLECRGEIVTESAVGEAAFRTLNGTECGVVSVTPSDWDFSPVKVDWKLGNDGSQEKTAKLENWRKPDALERHLNNAPTTVRSWDDLRVTSERRFENILFSDNCFEPLNGVPFARSSADRILMMLQILDEVASAFDPGGARTPAGHRIHRDHFTGDNALFSDSSESEKRNFRRKLTFPHPVTFGETLFCPWHGKERHLNLRLHYYWSGKPGDQVMVVYVGRKITV